ncbi:hypothetical protein BHE74_00019165 [Ensete ventricosum]|nr:hypothetical protein BHE74_00019165 [Ensete ventricosum]
MTKLLVFAINIIYVSFSGSSASHSFIVESKAKGMFHGSPAVIKFHIPTKAALQEAYYTPIQPLDVLADKPPEKKFEWAQEREGGPRRSRHCRAAVSEHNPAVWKWTHEAIAWCCT